MPHDPPWRSLWLTSADGLRLHARDYGCATSPRLPVVCLPGLARTAADFDELATALSRDADAPRRVLAVDYRGRGLSDRDPNPANYDIRIENADIQALLKATGIERTVMIGTSRGGIHVMALAALRPAAIAAAVLNDIGPVIETAGLLRIKGYVGRLAAPSSLEDAAEAIRAAAGPGFTAFGPRDWLRLAARTFVEADGRYVPAYDPALLATLDGISADRPVPPLWDVFDRLGAVPLMAIRGENSDVLSAETFAAMRARRPDMTALTLPGQAHAPPLWEPEVIAAIQRFILQVENQL